MRNVFALTETLVVFLLIYSSFAVALPQELERLTGSDDNNNDNGNAVGPTIDVPSVPEDVVAQIPQPDPFPLPLPQIGDDSISSRSRRRRQAVLFVRPPINGEQRIVVPLSPRDGTGTTGVGYTGTKILGTPGGPLISGGLPRAAERASSGEGEGEEGEGEGEGEGEEEEEQGGEVLVSGFRIDDAAFISEPAETSVGCVFVFEGRAQRSVPKPLFYGEFLQAPVERANVVVCSTELYQRNSDVDRTAE